MLGELLSRGGCYKTGFFFLVPEMTRGTLERFIIQFIAQATRMALPVITISSI